MVIFFALHHNHRQIGFVLAEATCLRQIAQQSWTLDDSSPECLTAVYLLEHRILNLVVGSGVFIQVSVDQQSSVALTFMLRVIECCLGYQILRGSIILLLEVDNILVD